MMSAQLSSSESSISHNPFNDAAAHIPRYTCRKFTQHDLKLGSQLAYQSFNELNDKHNKQHDFASVEVVESIIRSELHHTSHGNGYSIVCSDKQNQIISSGHIIHNNSNGIAHLSMINASSHHPGSGKLVVSELLNYIKSRSDINSVRLVTYLENDVSVSLYTKLGFRIVSIFAQCQGNILSESKLSVELQMRANNITVRAMTVDDINECDKLFNKATQLHRSMDLQSFVQRNSSTCLVATCGSSIVGYITSHQIDGHLIADDSLIESTDGTGYVVTRALICSVDTAVLESQTDELWKSKLIGVHITSIDNPQLLCWCICSGLRINRHNTLMVHGNYAPTNTKLIYLPSIEW